MTERIIRVLVIEPMEKPIETYIPNKLKFMSKIINEDELFEDMAELVVLEEGVGIIRNKDGALLELKGNRKVNDEIIAGTFLIVGINKEGFATSLSNEQVTKYSKLFEKEEFYTDKETRQSYWKKFEENINLMDVF